MFGYQFSIYFYLFVIYVIFWFLMEKVPFLKKKFLTFNERFNLLNIEALKKLHQRAQKNYLYTVFITRYFQRFANILLTAYFLVLIFVGYLSVTDTMKPVLKAEEMHQTTGVLHKVWYERKASRIGMKFDDYEKLPFVFYISSYHNAGKYFDEQSLYPLLQRLIGEEISISYMKDWSEYDYWSVHEIEHNKTLLINYNEECYPGYLDQYNNVFDEILIWVVVILIWPLWHWYLNKKELPIHRLNRMKKYLAKKEEMNK